MDKLQIRGRISGTNLRGQIASYDGVLERVNEGLGALNEEINEVDSRLSGSIGDFIHTKVGSSRSYDIDVTTSVGDEIYFSPIKWTGQSGGQFHLYGYANGAYEDLGYTTELGQRYIWKTKKAYSKMRISISNISAYSTPQTYSAIVANLTQISIAAKVLKNEEKLNIIYPDYLPTAIKLTQTAQSRSFSFPVDFKKGEILSIKVSRYTGSVTPKGINIYLSTDGTTYKAMYVANSVGDTVKMVIQEDVIGLRIGTVLPSAPSSAVTIDVEIVKDPMEQMKALEGKRLSILGASISTFNGMIPSGNSVYYPHSTTDANAVLSYHDTYWGKLMDATGMVLCVNNSSAGSYCTTGHGSDSMAGCGDRCVSLHTETAEPDVIIIQLGGNDFNYNAPIGEYNGTQDFPSDTSKFREAYAIMLKKMQTRYPLAKILCGTIPPEDRSAPFGQVPEKNENGVMIEVFNNAIREIASLFQLDVLEFNRCGLHIFNRQYLYQDYASSGYAQHPNRLGHSLMANECIKTIAPSCDIRFAHTVVKN